MDISGAQEIVDVLCAVSGPVRNLKCDKTLSPSVLQLSWDVPSAHGEGVNEYRVEVKELQQSPGTSDIVLVDVANFHSMMEQASLEQGLSKLRNSHL